MITGTLTGAKLLFMPVILTKYETEATAEHNSPEPDADAPPGAAEAVHVLGG
jgi:hypothetical protein